MLRKRSFDTLCALSERCKSWISALRARLRHRCPIPARVATKRAHSQVTDKPPRNGGAGMPRGLRAGRTAGQAEAILGRFRAEDRREALARRIGERVTKIVRDYDAEAIEEVFSDGLLNVMDAPEFAQSDKLR